MKHLPLAVILLVSAAVVALLVRTDGGGDAILEAPGAAAASQAEASAPVDARPPASPRRNALAPVVAAPPGALEPEALRGRLEELARAELASEAALDELLRPPLLDPANVRRALALLVSGALKEAPDTLTSGELGAIRLVGFATAIYNSEDGARDLCAQGFAVDGPTFTEEVLRALARIEEPAASALAGMLAGLTVEGGRVVGRSHLPLLRVLVALYPDRESMYAILMAGLGEEEPLAFDLEFLTGDEDPQLVKSHLVAAFEKADRAQALQLLKLAEELYEAGGEELRGEIAQAVATAAPVDLAAGFLAERASPYMLGQFDSLGLRPGGPDALARSYDDLAATGADAAARRMIVSGLAGVGSEALLGIAELDPDPTVRGQAAVTATWAPDFAPSAEFLGELRRLAALGDQGLPAYATISTARNLLAQARLAGDDALAAQTVGFLRELALDPNVPAHDRAKIPGILEQHLPPAEHEALEQMVSQLASD